ncbi:MAG: copper resistance protein NlpE N-terminal domain-containing protein [Bacteroidaceae bacterium]|nr:copper resistance protein NlpE N-terminal domain-containing protein [Bacteroidaceae bacterium]
MKKLVLLATFAATMFTACNSCGGEQQPVLVIETETDSLYMVNDSTIGDLQTFVFEGLMPMDGGKAGNTQLTIESVSLNDDGTYTITTTYMDENMQPKKMNDSGETVVLIGMPNDSTAVIYELVSYGNNQKMHMLMNSDTTLTRLDSKMQPISKNRSHRLVHKK